MVKFPLYSIGVYIYIHAIQQPSRSTKDARWIIKFLVAGNGSRVMGFQWLSSGRETLEGSSRITTRESSTPGKEGKRRRMRSVLMLAPLDQVRRIAWRYSVIHAFKRVSPIQKSIQKWKFAYKIL